jgi:predicted double-glycine peptidase
MSLEDEGMTNVFVDEKGGFAVFDSEFEQEMLIEKLNTIFKDLKEYSYSNLKRKE